MPKLFTAILAAALIAGAVTVFTAPATKVSAGPLANAVSAPMQTCRQRPWPYLNCVGTPYGNPHIRLVTTERLAD
jgi:Spy/CpxP family protein refolding chaperone